MVGILKYEWSVSFVTSKSLSNDLGLVMISILASQRTIYSMK